MLVDHRHVLEHYQVRPQDTLPNTLCRCRWPEKFLPRQIREQQCIYIFYYCNLQDLRRYN